MVLEKGNADINELNKDMDRMLMLFEVSNEGLFDMDSQGRIRYYNKSFYSKFDLDYENATIEQWKALVHPDDRGRFETALEEQMKKQMVSYRSEYKVITKKGDFVWIEAYGIVEFDDDGEMLMMMGSHRDITDQKVSEGRIYSLAYVDGLTGLYNRSKLDEMLIMQMSMKSPGALIYLNINQFKLVNDTYGDETGNRVLIRVAERLKQILNENCMLFRIHADEFAILVIQDIASRNLKTMVQKMQNTLEGRVTLKEKVLDISTSVGVCKLPMDVASPEELVQRAKLTMRYGRQLKKNRYTFFDESVEKSVMQELHIETGIKSALEANELYLNYQPIINTQSGKVTSFEALVRWKSALWGEIYPDQFIPVAERTLDIIEIGRFVLQSACLFIKNLREETGEPLKVSVNVSVVQLVQSNFADEVLGIINEVGVHPSAVVLEITESLTLDANEDVLERLTELDSNGVFIALDDFGTGYSSLNNFITIPMKTLKVDRKVMEKAMSNAAINRFITSVVKLCHEMELKVVAEGIEDDEMVEKARIMRVDFLQGYHFARPLSEDAARAYVLE